MKNKVTPRFYLLLLFVAFATYTYATQGMNFNYAKSFNTVNPSKSNSIGSQIVQDDSGYLYACFALADTTDIDPGTGLQLFAPQPGAYTSLCFVKLTKDGQLVWAKNLIADTYIGASKMVYHNGALYLFGAYRSNADFDPNAGTAYLSGNGSQNTPFVAKYTTNGDYVFAKNMASSSGDVSIAGVAVNSFHQFIIAGTFFEPTDFDPTAGTYNRDPVLNGYYDAYVAAYDSNFTTVTAYRLAGAANTSADDFVDDVAVDADDNIYVTGYSGSTPLYPDFFGTGNALTAGNTNGNGFIIKYNDLFQLQWAHNFNSTGTNLIDNMVVYGGGLYLNVRCDAGVIDFDASANSATSDFNTQPGRAIALWDLNGGYVFHKAWHGAGNNNSYIAFSGLSLSYNKILVSGYYVGSTIDLDPDVPVTYAAPTTSSNPFTMLLNGTGNLLQHTELPGNDSREYFATFDKQDDQYFYFGGGYSDTLLFDAAHQNTTLIADKDNSSVYNSFISRYDLLDIPPDTASKTMVFTNVTDTTMTVSFTPGNGDKRLVLCRAVNPVDTVPSDAIYYSADTVFMNGSNFDGRYAVYNDVGSSFTVTGLTPNTMYYFEVYEFNGFSSQINFLTSSTLTGNHKTTLNGTTGVANISEQNNWNVFPNPATSSLSIFFGDAPQANTTMRIIDLSGKTLLDQNAAGNNIQQIDISLLSSGIYFVEIRNGAMTQTRKFIKE